MNTENTEEMITRAAHRLAFGVPANEVIDGLRAEGNSDEVVFLVVTAAKLLAKRARRQPRKGHDDAPLRT